MDEPIVPSFEMLRDFTGWVGFEGRWYEAIAFVEVNSVPDLSVKYQHSLSFPSDATVRFLSLTEENGGEWVAWLQKIGEGKIQDSEMVTYQEQTYVLDALGEGASCAGQYKTTYSYRRYRSGNNNGIFLLMERFDDWWRHCIGRKIELSDIVVVPR